MEDKNDNYNTTKNSRSYETRESKSGWIIGGTVALVAVLGIVYYNNISYYDNNDGRGLQNIAPAAGSRVQGSTTPALQPDNTQINMRDRNADEATADQQQENEADRTMTQMIRQSVMEDKSLSSYAQNIKIISQDGVVTLKGPVSSENEKRIILEKSVAVTGNTDKVIDQISITR